MSVSCVLTEHQGEFHVLYNDFLRICYGDRALADALRGFEVRANWRAGYLIERYGIEDGFVPSDDDMWFELSLRQLQALTLGAQSKSTYARTVAEIPVPRTEDDEVAPPSLLSLGYIERRYIARPADDLPHVPEVPTTLYRDDKGVFIIVSREGCYMGYDEALHYAPFERYSQIVTQYRYCDVRVNAALAQAQWLDPPDPAPRWRPLVQRRKGAINPDETTNPQHDSASMMNEASSQISAEINVANRGGILDVADSSFKNQNITEFPELSTAESAPEARNSHIFGANSMKRGLSKSGQGCPRQERGVQQGAGASKVGRNKNQNQDKDLSGSSKKDSAALPPSFSLYRDTVDFEQLRTAPWNAETVVALLSRVLAIPASSEVSEETWRAECLDQGARLIEKTAELPPTRAWEAIDIVSRRMETPGSPSWWQRPISEGGRVTKSPVTPKNVADNFEREWADFKRTAHLWQPQASTPYDGPPLTDYERGYGGIEAQASSEDAAPTAAFGGQAEQGQALPTTDEVPAVQIAESPPEPVAPLYAMSREEAADLADLIAAQYPMLSLGSSEYDDGSFAICIEHEADRWIMLRSHRDWYDPPPITLRRIRAAIAFGESRAGGDGEAGKEHDGGAEAGAMMEEIRT
jgi:hypothetical protein